MKETCLPRGINCLESSHPTLGEGGTQGGRLLAGVPTCPDLAGVRTGGVDRQTPVKTVPYRRTTYTVGKNARLQRETMDQ